MAPKGKGQKPVTEKTSNVSTTINLDHVPLVDQFFKITETKCEFEIYELHLWLNKNI